MLTQTSSSVLHRVALRTSGVKSSSKPFGRASNPSACQRLVPMAKTRKRVGGFACLGPAVISHQPHDVLARRRVTQPLYGRLVLRWESAELAHIRIGSGRPHHKHKQRPRRDVARSDVIGPKEEALVSIVVTSQGTFYIGGSGVDK